MKVILNHLPPGRIDHPSSSFSILQSFLNQNGFTAKTIYWNILMFPVMSYYENNHDLFRNLFPFLTQLAEEFQDKSIEKRLLSYLQTLKPYYKTKDNFYDNSLSEIRSLTDIIFNNEIKKDENQAVLYGISAKFYQWIPGRMLAKIIKQTYPVSKIVIGGLNNKDSAVAMLKKNPNFDYAIWGEGEYPLLELCNYMDNKSVILENIPRLVYREKGEIKISKTAKSKYLDFKNYIFPDISDYIDTLSEYKIIPKDKVQLLIHTVCGCRWNKCSFCTYSLDKAFRERNAENIFEEIKMCSEKYGINNFYMVDNEIVGKEAGRFEKLLDLLIDFKENIQNDFRIYGEMIPSAEITPEIFSKMSRAGFKYLFIGYEAITDGLLKKMKKENTFSENILFVKSALKFKIRPQVNILQDIPSETEDDIYESINNLHFLRFFFHDKNAEFVHEFLTLNLYKGTEYYRKMSDAERSNYTVNPITDFIPRSFIPIDEQWDFFSFRRNQMLNSVSWYDFRTIENFYKKNEFSYHLKFENTQLIYIEYFNKKEIKKIIFNNTIEYEILLQTENQILSFKKLFQNLLIQYPDLTEDDLKENLVKLKRNYLIYFDTQFSSIISILNFPEK
ncbi:MAG: radical SAM protein [Paludibacter sp.]|nr:radical SAM protein [Paludibacter sp.]